MEQQNDTFDYLFKIVLVGDTNVGKTNILERLVNNNFKTNAQPTIGVEFGTKIFECDNTKVKAQIWDTAGQERYHAIISAYYRGATGAVIVYDITNKTTFKNATAHWLKSIKKACVKETPILILANKLDLEAKREIKTEIGRDAALSNQCAFFETSAKDGKNIESAFSEFIEHIYQKEKGKNNLKNKRYARREDLKGEELKLVRDENKKGCC